MKLLVDIGNTRLKWAWLEAGRLGEPGAVLHAGGLPRQTLAAMRGLGQQAAEIVVASVAAQPLTAAMATLLEDTFSAPVRMAETEAGAAGVRNGYAEPKQLGVDRWLAILAAFAHFRRAVCVIDAGTALTVDAVGRDGRHLGGLIVPGRELMRSALLRATGGISSAAQLAPARQNTDHWGRDTESCMRLGSLHALNGLIEGCMRALSASDGGAALAVTGGDAPALLAALQHPAEHRPLLVLEGLALRYGP